MKKIIFVIPLLLGLLAIFLLGSDEFERKAKADEIALAQCISHFPLTFSYQNKYGEVSHGRASLKKYKMGVDFSSYNRNEDLNEVPNQVFQNSSFWCIKELNFNYNELSIIPSGIENLPQLKRIHLENNRITAIPAHIFDKNQNLKSVYLNNNNLKVLDLNTFKLMNNIYLNDNNIDTVLAIMDHNTVSKLEIRNNKLATLDLNAFKSITNLDLSRNRITKIRPLNPKRSSVIRTLNLTSNRLKRFPLAVQALYELDQLNLSHNYIGLDPSFSEFPFEKLLSIGKLDLNGNSFTRFPKELGKMPNLMYLELDKNPIMGEVVFEGFNRLSKIEMKERAIESFIIKPASLAQLSTLDLRDNQIHTFEIKTENTSLNNLHLQRNQLFSVPPSLNALTGLSNLNLSDNQIETLPSLSQLIGLRELDLSKNFFTEIPELGQVYQEKKYYQDFILNLSINPIEVLDLERVDKNITELILSRNKISSIQNLVELPNLRKLNLRDNSNLKEFPLEIFDYLINLETLNLKGTSIDDAMMRKIIKIARNKQIRLIKI